MFRDAAVVDRPFVSTANTAAAGAVCHGCRRSVNTCRTSRVGAFVYKTTVQSIFRNIAGKPRPDFCFYRPMHVTYKLCLKKCVVIFGSQCTYNSLI